MMMYRYLIWAILTCLWMPNVWAQTPMSTQAMSTCDLVWADPGGTGNYGNSLDMSQTFSPDNAAAKLRLSFTAFDTEQGFDKLYIYDGGNTSANLLGVFSGNTLPGTFTASNAQGQLTLRFVSDAQNNAAGWQAKLSCIVLPQAPSVLALSVVSQTQIDVQWQDNSDNETGFKLERSANDQSNFTQIAQLSAGVVSYQDKNLTANTVYYYRVRAYNNDGNSAFANQQTATTLPNAPIAPNGLSAQVISSSEIALAWQDNSDNETSFVLERSQGDDQNFSQVAIVDKNVKNYTDKNLVASTHYYYRIKAVNTGGNSAYSTHLLTQTQAPPPPQAPSLLTLEALSPSQIKLTWQDNASSETGFVVERSTGNANSFEVVANVEANLTTYTDASLQETTTYFYRVKAMNTGGSSAYTNLEQATTWLDVPTTPTQLSATTIGQHKVRLSWQDMSGTETGFSIERKKNGEANFQVINASVAANVTTYEDTGLEALTTYTYRIRAFNASGISAYSNETSTTTLIEVPKAPTNLLATPVSQTSIELNWQDVANTETGYVLELAVGNSAQYETIATLPTNTQTYTDVQRLSEVDYHYRLTAINNGGSSTPVLLTVRIPALPEAPDSLYAQALAPTKVQLFWRDVAVNEEGFVIERATEGGNFEVVGKVAANMNTYIDSSLTPLTFYQYRVKAVHSAGESFYSNTATINLAVGLSYQAQQLARRLSLSPNPGRAQAHLSLSHTYQGALKVWVRGLQGELFFTRIFDKKQQHWQTTLPLAHLPAGIYLIEVQLKNIKVAKRWVKQ